MASSTAARGSLLRRGRQHPQHQSQGRQSAQQAGIRQGLEQVIVGIEGLIGEGLDRAIEVFHGAQTVAQQGLLGEERPSVPKIFRAHEGAVAPQQAIVEQPGGEHRREAGAAQRQGDGAVEGQVAEGLPGSAGDAEAHLCGVLGNGKGALGEGALIKGGAVYCGSAGGGPGRTPTAGDRRPHRRRGLCLR